MNLSLCQFARMKTSSIFCAFAIWCAGNLLLLSTACANLGETDKEVSARYGPSKTTVPEKPAEKAQVYSSQDMQTLVQFWKERSCSEQYRKTSVLSEPEIAGLLKANVGDSSWHQASADVWVRIDKLAIAYKGDQGRGLVVQTYAFHSEVQKNRSHVTEQTTPPPPTGKVVPASMTKITARYLGADVPPDSFAAKPKTFYMAGNAYLRLEEEPDSAQHLQELVICSEPDIWMINLEDHQGKHLVDPGPTFETHNTILPPKTPGELGLLEMGHEAEFFAKHHATPLEAVTIEGQSCEVSEYKEENYRLVLNSRADSHQPFQLDVFKDGKPDASVRYLSYQMGLPFKPDLFTPPANATITEQKAEAQ